MSKLRVTLAVHDSDASVGWTSGKFRMYHRDYESPYAPRMGDRIEIFDSATQDVKSTSWRLSGDLEVELVPFQLDPVPEAQSLCDGQYRSAWYTARDNDLESQLVRAGWHFEDDDIESLDLTVRAYNVLKREGVDTIAQLIQHTIDQLYDMRNMGWKSVELIMARLADRGLKLKPVRMYPNDYHHEEY